MTPEPIDHPLFKGLTSVEATLLTTATPTASYEKPSIPKLAYNVDEAAAASGLCKHLLREAISTGQLRARKIGRRWIILADDLRKFLA